jgi:hypothetical protein
MDKFLWLLQQCYEGWNVNDLTLDQVQEVWDKSRSLTADEMQVTAGEKE